MFSVMSPFSLEQTSKQEDVSVPLLNGAQWLTDISNKRLKTSERGFTDMYMKSSCQLDRVMMALYFEGVMKPCVV